MPRVICFPKLLTLVTCFPTHDSPYMFFYAWHWLHVFPHTTRLTCFPMLGTGYMFSHTCLAVHVFLCLALVTCFPTHDSPYIFFCAWHWLHVFPHMTCKDQGLVPAGHKLKSPLNTQEAIQIVKSTCRRLVKARINDCHRRLNCCNNKLQQQLDKLEQLLDHPLDKTETHVLSYGLKHSVKP